MENLNSKCFAYPAKKKYPVHTKQAALNSYQQFKSDIDRYDQDQISYIANNFIKAASLHHIKYPTQTLTKTATYNVTLDDGTLVQMSVTSQNNLDKIASSLQNSQLDYRDIKKIATQIIRNTDQMDYADTALQKLRKLAGFGVGQPSQIVNEFCKRGQYIGQKQKSMFYSVYRDINALDQDTLLKKASQICQLMYGIDKLYKLAAYYDTALKRPQQVCFKQGFKQLQDQAQDYMCVKSTSTILSKKALLQRKDKVKQFFNQFYQQQAKDDTQLLNKVANLSQIGLKALIQELK